MAKVFLGVPIYGEQVHATVLRSILSARAGGIDRWAIHGYSVLTKNFNDLLATALTARTEGFTHFAILHADVQPQPGWVDTLLSLMEDHAADALSVILPIKDRSGFTSTAIDDSEMPHAPRRLHLIRDVANRPPTFTDPLLLINTGCLLISITKPWIESCWFQCEDEIVRLPNGTFEARNVSEDWSWSRRAKALGASLWATRAVSAIHHGAIGFPNRAP